MQLGDGSSVFSTTHLVELRACEHPAQLEQARFSEEAEQEDGRP